MLHRISYIILLFSLTVNTIWAQPGVESENFQKFSSIEEMVRYYDDPVNCTLEALDFAVKEAIRQNELDAAAKLKLYKTRLYYNQKDYESALKTAYATLNFVEQFGEENFANVVPRVHFRIAQALIEIGAFKEAVHHRKLQQIKLRKIDAFERANELDHYIGNLYWNLHEIDSARFYFQRHYQSSKENMDPRQIAFSRNNIGLTYFDSKDFKSAVTEFEAARKFYKQDTSLNGQLMYATVLGNIAYCEYQTDDLSAALNLLNEAVDLSEKAGKSQYIINTLMLRAEVLCALKRFPQALQDLDASEQLMELTERFSTYRLRLLNRYMLVYEDKGDYAQSLNYAKKYMDLYESLYGEKKMEELYAARSSFQNLEIKSKLSEERYKNERQQEEINDLNVTTEIIRFRIILITLSAILVLVAAAFFIYRLKRKNEIQRLSQELLEATNERQSQRLTETSLNLARKKEFAEDLKSKITQLEGLEAKDKSAIKLFVDNELQIDETFLEMEKLIDQLGDEFFVKLKNKFPQLTENDLKLCGLIRLKLTTKQISIVKSITPDSVKVSKYRLSKKLGVKKGTVLYEFLKDI